MQTLDISSTFGKAVLCVITFTATLLVYESVIADKSGKEFAPKANQACVGQPLEVDYPYQGGMLDPHACAVQCEDEVQRYIVYTNGKATQCQILPGCLDWGEDQGTTCVIPKVPSS